MSLASTYYQALELKPTATEKQVKAAYRRLSLKYHPESNYDDLPREQCVALLRQLSNALEVLTSKRLRTRYDTHGVAGVEGHKFKDPQRVFDEFFGTANPFAAVLPTGPANFADAVPEHAFRDQAPSGVKKGRTAAAKIPITLNELYKGCQKRLKVTRQRVVDGGTALRHETKFLHVQIPPGTREGTKIRFENEGDEVPGQLPSDILFELSIQQHPVYERQGNDLVCRKKISLLEALTNCITKVETLDGRILSVASHTIITPQTRKVVVGEGMPIPSAEEQSKLGLEVPSSGVHSGQDSEESTLGTMLPSIRRKPLKYGNLIIEYEINFPAQLNQSQKHLLREALGSKRR